MASVPAVPEFRDADQCRQHGLEIIRPKPRRLGDLNRPHDTRMPAEGASLRATHRDLVGGSAPSLTKLSVRDLWPSPSGRASHEASPRPCLSAAASSSSPGPPGSSRATPVRETPALSSSGGGASSRASPGSLALSAATRASPAHKLSLAEASMVREQEDQQQDEGFSPDPNFSVYRDSASNTDCGSLSKSSSDGDPVVSRRKPLARLKSRRRNILSFPLNPEDPRLGTRRHDLYAGGSSSDENRSSGHASMSDGGQSSYASSTSPPTYLDFARATPSATPLTKSLHNVPGHLKAVPEDDRVPITSVSASRLCRRSQPSSSSSSHGRRGYRSSSGVYELHDNSSANLDDIRQAVEQLAARTQQGSSGCGGYSTSTYSSDAEPGGGSGVRRLMRHSSLETIATNITSAEEFVWVDNLQSRLVEMQRPPWTNHDVLRVLQSGRLREQRRKISMEVVPRLSFLLQRPLVRVAREAQRLSRPLGVCGKRQVSGALCIVLSPALAESCVSACHRAAAMYTSSSCDQLRLGKSARAGLQLPVGRFQRWACDARLAPCVHEYGALYLTAAAENLLEELVLRCLEPGATLTAAALEAAIASSGELWGLFQPFAHLNAGRTATGAMSMPRWPQQPSSGRGQGPEAQQPQHQQPGQQPPKDDHHRAASSATSDAHEQSFLTTCVGSIAELSELLGAVTQLYRSRTGSQRVPLSWGPGAVHALYHYMRCSQLEHAEHGSSRRSAGPELIYERPYQVLPPLVEWVRVAHAHAEYRRSSLVDQDDVMQAARLLLPGVDCPVRAIGELHEERLLLRRPTSATGVDDIQSQDWARQLQTELAFRLLSLCGQPGAGAGVISQALALLPASTRLDTRDQRGLTPLMLACARGDEAAARLLVQAGADIHAEAPLCTPQCPLAIPEVQGWTALTFATTQGMVSTVRILLEKGANVEGSEAPNEEKVTETPLQLAVAFSHLELIGVLLSYGAKPFCATPFLDAQSYGGAHPRGCYGAAAVAAAHGRRSALRRLLAHRALPEADDQGDVLSLHEILAEGAAPGTTDRRTIKSSKVSNPDEGLEGSGQQSQQRKAGQSLSKAHIKALQEAMYQSAENGYLEVTLDLRSIGVPWTLHCWMQTLTMAHEQQLENTIDELLQDFLHVWPEDCSTQFVEDCLPLLFSIFRHSKNEGTTLLLADIFSVCYGEDSIKEIRDVSLSGGARIDPKYVNNPEMSDVQFRVEGRAFYAHKIILVNASPRFKSMLASKSAEGTTPVVQINDIRYDIFQLVMQYLYKGGCEDFDIDQNDVLELLTAATFFQLDGLVRFCEARCSKCVDLDNVVATYVHAKVYNAVQLLEYCQGFLLQNLVALLSYDDGVRKLLFGKRLHNHDVLSGLLLTLQARVKQRVAMTRSLAGKRASTGHDAKMRLVGPNK